MKLTADQIAELEEDLRREDVKKYADRIRVILLLARGWSPTKIAEALFLDPSTIHRYRASYLEGGLEQLIYDGFMGRKSKLTDNEKSQLALFLKENPPQTTKEVLQLVKKRFGITYSVSGINTVLHNLGFNYKKPKSVSAKRNYIAQEEFVENLEVLRENLDDGEKIFFADAVHPEMNAHPQYGWFPSGERAEVLGSASKIRHNVIGALNIDDLDSSFRSYDRINKSTVIDFLKYFERRHNHLSKIYLVVDNAQYFVSNKVRSFLKQSNSKVVLIFLPPYSPNLNPIERLWKYLHKKVLNNRYFSSEIDFRNKITDFLRKFSNFKPDLRSLLTYEFENIPT